MVNSNMLIIESDILPEVFSKVIEAKKLLSNGDANTIQEACKQVKLSRSAFYKYKDRVFDYSSQEKGRIITLFILLRHIPGALSDIINSIASAKGNIITINQTIPIMNTASLTVTIDTKQMDTSPDGLIQLLLSCKGCKKVDIVGME